MQKKKKGHFFSLTVMAQILFYAFFLCIPRDVSEREMGNLTVIQTILTHLHSHSSHHCEGCKILGAG